jgi:protein-disulfide isomerase
LKKSFKKLALVLCISSVFVGAQASEDVDNQMLDTFGSLKNTLSTSSASIAELPVSLDENAKTFMSLANTDYVPVMFSGRRFLTDPKGQVLTDPNTFFIINKTGIVKASDILIDLEFTGDNSLAWPTMPLIEGVQKKGDLYVITDPTCGYCQKVEEEVTQYMENGIQVHLIPYPRTGLNTETPAYQKWASALCSDNPAEAYNDIILGKGDYPVPTDLDAECTEMIKKGLELGARLGISGTPYMYGKGTNGEVFAQGGYVPVKDFGPRIGVVIKDNGLSTLMN